jgi:hypothetical protein
MRTSLVIVGLLLSGLLLVGCNQTNQIESSTGFKKSMENPLVAEAIADNMLEYVASMEIDANQRGESITDPKVLRAIDDAFVFARGAQKGAHALQDKGKGGGVHGVNGNFSKGRILLIENTLYFGYWFEIDAAPGIEMYLSYHVSPHESEELFSQPTRKIGALKNIMGAQSYSAGEFTEDEWNKFRTVAFYSKPLDQVIAFAQIRPKFGAE